MNVRLDLTDEMTEALRAWRATHPKMSDAEERENGVMYYGSIGGGFMITFDGRVLEEDWEAHTLKELTESTKRLTALVLAAERMPSFAELLPSRPVAASDCATCSGVGRWSPGAPHSFVCGHCGGVGWVVEAAAV
jgi:hypothetical protein